MIAALQTNVSNGTACSCSCSNSRDTLCLRFHKWNDWIVNESMYSNQAVQVWKGEGRKLRKIKLRKMFVTWILGLLFAGGYWANCHNKGPLFTLSKVGGPQKNQPATDDPWRKLVALLGASVLDTWRFVTISMKGNQGWALIDIPTPHPPPPPKKKNTHTRISSNQFFHLTPFKVPLALASQIW